MKYFRTLLLSTALFLPFIGKAQEIVKVNTFRAGAPVMMVGYPSKIVQGKDENLAFVEYWNPDKAHQAANFYIESYTLGFEESWNKPLTRKGAASFDFKDIFRMKSKIIVLGEQFSASIKRTQVMAQYFSLDGSPVGGPTKVSIYDKKAKKGFEDFYSQSADGSKLLWMGSNPSASANKRRYMFAVMDDGGRPTWSKELKIPHTDEKYYVKQAEVDNKGNLYLLMAYSTFTNSAKDIEFPPIIVRYDYRENKFSENVLSVANASVPEGRIHVNQDNELYFLGMLAVEGAAGFPNGEKVFGASLPWNKILARKFKIERELQMVSDSALEMPEELLNRYKEKGSNFSESRIIEANGKIFWMLEEVYMQMKGKTPAHYYYDVATIGMNKKTGAVDWVNVLEKKQRNYESGVLLSFTPAFVNGQLRMVYLDEIGARGKLRCHSIDPASGKSTSTKLANNQDGTWMFFPGRSCKMEGNYMALMGVGLPNQDDFKVIIIGF